MIDEMREPRKDKLVNSYIPPPPHTHTHTHIIINTHHITPIHLDAGPRDPLLKHRPQLPLAPAPLQQAGQEHRRGVPCGLLGSGGGGPGPCALAAWSGCVCMRAVLVCEYICNILFDLLKKKKHKHTHTHAYTQYTYPPPHTHIH